jgi:hypothetical protein
LRIKAVFTFTWFSPLVNRLQSPFTVTLSPIFRLSKFPSSVAQELGGLILAVFRATCRRKEAERDRQIAEVNSVSAHSAHRVTFQAPPRGTLTFDANKLCRPLNCPVTVS